MFKLIRIKHKENLSQIVNRIPNIGNSILVEELKQLIEAIHHDIPSKKRISYGRYTIVKNLGLLFYNFLDIKQNINLIKLTVDLYNHKQKAPFVKSMALQLLALKAIKSGELDITMQVFRKAACHNHWQVRESAAGLIRQLVKHYPEPFHEWYLQLVKSQNPYTRRFVSESLRPVVENKWFLKNPDYPLSILKFLFNETHPYPRTSVGNNLSDWSKKDPDRIYKIITKLVVSKDKNSYWIAYRACRNLVKKNPDKVMNLLGVTKYKYKKNRYKLNKSTTSTN